MAKAIHTLDAIRVLLNGGQIAENFPKISGKTEYWVQLPHDLVNGAYKDIAHITEKQFSELQNHKLLQCTRCQTYENGGGTNFWRLRGSEHA